MRHRAFSTLHAEYLSAAPFPVCQARTGKGGEGNTYEIRTAEERYKARHGGYSGDFQTLIKGKYLQESLLYIPYSDGKKFTLSATTIVSKSGKQIPLMECGASYEDFLNGLDENAVQELIDNAMISGAYPGLKIGDITTDNNNAGNW